MKRPNFLLTRSIRDLLKLVFVVMILCFVLTSAIHLTYIRRIAREYGQQIENVQRANSLSQMVKEEIARESWYIVAGRTSFEDSRLSQILDKINSDLSTLYAKASPTGGRELVEAAMRATKTLTLYVERLQEQCGTGAPVSYQQMTLGEINKVSDNIYDVLQEFTYAQMNDIAAVNAQMQRTTLRMMVIMVALTLVVISIAIAAYRILKWAVERPNVELEAMAERILRGDLTTRVLPPGLQELNKLSESINLMNERIQALLDRSLEEQKELQKAELRALQAQITPHFLYNTFDTIVWLAESGHNEEVIKITIAFSNYCRIGLSRGQDFITVEQELEHVRDYLVIQEIRYGDILRYTIDVDESMYPRKMLKLLLQPLVENALYHGIKSRRQGGEITVKGRLLPDGGLRFEVRDNGMGIPPEKLEQIKAGLSAKSPPESSGYGLYNVSRRLELYYSNARLEISSRYNEGTTVAFTLPPKEEE